MGEVGRLCIRRWTICVIIASEVSGWRIQDTYSFRSAVILGHSALT